MSGFYSKALVNIKQLIGDIDTGVDGRLHEEFYDFATSMINEYDGPDEYKTQLDDFSAAFSNCVDGEDEATSLTCALCSKEGMKALLHQDKYANVKCAFYYYLTKWLCSVMTGENGNVIGDYFITDNDNYYTSCEDDALIFGFAEPEAIVKFVDDIPAVTVNRATWLLKEGGLMGETMSDDLIKKIYTSASTNNSKKPDVLYMRSAFELLSGVFNDDSPAFGCDDWYCSTFPNEYLENKARKNPEDYIVVSVLLKS